MRPTTYVSRAGPTSVRYGPFSRKHRPVARRATIQLRLLPTDRTGEFGRPGRAGTASQRRASALLKVIPGSSLLSSLMACHFAMATYRVQTPRTRQFIGRLDKH
ncbi:hypothetical protein SODALDRAFT_50648 [Sodiomyces alkalinus F11]|uniref:Uncharacterized protein n=1 Tax=Sodiomyces alkalinus (strain CBS 110278 / VKM F-3762 / F11) TaxID=1314773 RepID=A0A3N2PMM1_SODAK|nr:hypothetical protein SODALDRAFT_50648 [Sodiomyces alkalinus F11]ROT35763.1 hypothetical protein SODALDRAFT_50648 [Sodiomyces alkalinus F11]